MRIFMEQNFDVQEGEVQLDRNSGLQRIWDLLQPYQPRRMAAALVRLSCVDRFGEVE